MRILRNLFAIVLTIVIAQGCDTNEPSPKESKTPVPKLSISDASANEGSVATFVVSMDTTATEPVTFKYSTANGTATDADFTKVEGQSVTIPAGQRFASVSVTLKNDTEQEAAEIFKVTISDPHNAELSNDIQGVGTIINKPVAPTYFMKVKIGAHQWSATFDNAFFSPSFINNAFSGFGDGADFDTQLAFNFYETPTGPKTYEIAIISASDNDHVSVIYAPTFFSDSGLGPLFNAQPGGEVVLTRYDVENAVAEGTFKFTAINPGNNAKLEFVEGQFKIKIE
jgi:hypothetical protein